MRYKLRPYDVYTRCNVEGEKYYFRKIDADVQYLRYGREIRSGKNRHVFINKTGFSITVHVTSAVTTKKKKLSLSGALCKTVVL